MKKKLTDNLGLKILALLFSVILWMIVMNIDDPVKPKTLRDIEVKILNADAVTKEGKVYEILEDTDQIDVTVWAKSSILNSISRDNIVATANMEELTFMNTVRINLSTNENSDKLEDIKSDTENLKLNIEDMKRVQMVIETTTVGTPGEGYLLGDVSSDQNLVRLSGPASLISKVDRAAVEIKIEGITSSIQADYPLKLYDAEGNEIDNQNITKSVSNIRVVASILQEKQVPVTLRVSGTPAEGYALTGETQSNPDTVLIAGKSGILKNISEIVIPEEALNVNGLNSDLQTLIDISQYLPEGAHLTDSTFNGKISVTVSIQKEQNATVSLEKDKIALQNMPAGFSAHVSGMEEALAIQVSGLPSNMANMEGRSISGYIDMNSVLTAAGKTELTPGNYHAEVTLNLPSGVSTDNKVTVTLAVEQTES